MRMVRESKELLLDTHVWIWLVNGERKIQGGTLDKLIRDKRFSLDVRVSAMSVWEVGMLEIKGRIELPFDCLEWIRRALGAPGVSLAPVTAEIAVASSRLPGEFHGDPVDRILVATAQYLGATLVTQDSQILAYSKEHRLPAIAAF